MRSATDPRHKKRRDAVKNLYALTFRKNSFDAKIDKIISTSAPEWPIDKINRVDLAVLRLAVTELTDAKTPPKVVVDEAVELAKEYGSESSGSFVNGVLGTVIKNLKLKI